MLQTCPPHLSDVAAHISAQFTKQNSRQMSQFFSDRGPKLTLAAHHINVGQDMTYRHQIDALPFSAMNTASRTIDFVNDRLTPDVYSTLPYETKGFSSVGFSWKIAKSSEIVVCILAYGIIHTYTYFISATQSTHIK